MELEEEGVDGEIKNVVKGPMQKCGPGPLSTLRRHYLGQCCNEGENREIQCSLQYIANSPSLTPLQVDADAVSG